MRDDTFWRDAEPFLDLLAAPKPHVYGSPWGMEDR